MLLRAWAISLKNLMILMGAKLLGIWSYHVVTIVTIVNH